MIEQFLIGVFSDREILAPILFILFRALAIVIPPIPGFPLDLAGIIIFGPLLGFIYAVAGSMLGAVVSFWIARRYRAPVVEKFASLQKIQEWEKQFSEGQRFWTLVAMRIPTTAVFDYINYAAGLTRIKASRFFWATLLGELPYMIFIYFLGGASLRKGPYHTLGFLAVLVILAIIFGRKKLIKKIFDKIKTWPQKKQKI